ncbi:MAG: polysaccharide biosynthesis tyrosine autokinase [Rikenellaceae bacterium]
MRGDRFDKFDVGEPRRRGVEERSIVDMIGVLWYYKWCFLLSSIIIMAMGVLYIMSTPKIYSRTATLLITSSSSSKINTDDIFGLQSIYNPKQSVVNNEIGILKSTRLMREVVERLGLDVEYRTKLALRQISLYDTTPVKVDFQTPLLAQTTSLSVTIKSDGGALISNIMVGKVRHDRVYEVDCGDTVSIASVGDVVISTTPYMSDDYLDRPITVVRRSVEDVATSLSQNLRISLAAEYSELLKISLMSESWSMAQDVINVLIDIYVNDVIADKNIVVDNTLNFLGERLAIVKAELAVIDADIESYMKSNKLIDVVRASDLYMQSSRRISEERLSVVNQLSMARYMYSYITDENHATQLIPVNIGITEVGLNSLINEYNTQMTRRNRLFVNSSASNPLVIDLQSSLTAMRASIEESINNLIENLKIQADIYGEKERDNSDKIAYVPSQHKYIVSVQREQKIKEELYMYLLNKYESYQIMRTIVECNCRIVDAPIGSIHPVAPNRVIILLICCLLSLLVPSAIIYLRMLFNTSVVASKDIRELVDVPIVGEIPLIKDGISKSGVVTLAGRRNQVNEAFNIVRDNLEFLNPQETHRGRVVQIISSTPRAGKTFVSINLASSGAVTGSKMVLLDLDLRKGTLSTCLGFGFKEVGLSHYLSGGVELSDRLIRSCGSGVEGVDVIPCGATPPNPIELLKSDRLQRLIDYLRDRYDYVILDNPPYSVVVDAAICSRLADLSIFVIRSKMFDKRLLPNVQELYDSGRLHNMSILVNAVDYKNIGYGYDYVYCSD